MNNELILKKRVDLIKKSFKEARFCRHNLNASIHCINTRCGSRNSAKQKLILRIDTEQYHCWVCDLKGVGLYRFFSKYKPAYAQHAKEIFEKKLYVNDIKDIEQVTLPEGFTLLATLKDKCDPDLRAVRNYMRRRGCSLSDLWFFKVGAVSKGRYSRKAIVPSFDTSGCLNYFTARNIYDTGLKYTNPKVQRSKIIFNEINIDWKKELVLVEGPFDLFKAPQNSCCLLGSSLTKDHLLFRRIVENNTPVILSLDDDARHKQNKIANLLTSFGVHVKVTNIQAGKDVGEMKKNEFIDALTQAEIWNPISNLHFLIRNIRSGSLI